MKSFTSLSVLLAALLLTGATCKSKTQPLASCFKGRLEVKALCMNYTISVVEGKIDTSLVAASWTDESTGRTYTNAFGLGSPCNFPANLNAGDEFYFEIDPAPAQQCNVCMAYYPTPGKKLAIRVLPSCTETPKQ